MAIPNMLNDSKPYERDVQALRQISLLTELSEEHLRSLARVARRQLCCRQEQINARGVDDELYLVTHGGVRLYLISLEGRELTLGYWSAGEMLDLSSGETSVLDEVIAEATDDGTTVYAIPWALFLDVLAFRPGALLSLAGFFRKSQFQDRRLIKELAFYTVKRRLACRLIEIAEERSSGIVRRTHDVLAADIGARTEDVTKVLRDLSAMGLVTHHPYGRDIGIPSIQVLRAYAFPEN